MLELTPLEWEALLLSLRVATLSVFASLPLCLFIAWVLARRDFAGKILLDGLVHRRSVEPIVDRGNTNVRI